MNNAFAEVDGKPVLVQPEHVNFGLAIDLPKPDGSRSLVVASIKGAETMDFAGFWAAYEDIIRRARSNKLTMEDFSGTTISLTNPGTIGTNHSVPRLTAGPGRDHRRRRDGVPGRVPGDEPRGAHRDGRLEDHHADLDLRPPDHPGRRVRRLPAPAARAAARRATASTTRSSARCGSPTSRCAGCPTCGSATRGRSTRKPGSSRSSRPTGATATSWPTPTRSSSRSAPTPTSTSSSTG